MAKGRCKGIGGQAESVGGIKGVCWDNRGEISRAYGGVGGAGCICRGIVGASRVHVGIGGKQNLMGGWWCPGGFDGNKGGS